MSTHIQVRDVPDRVHRQLKARAALAGLSLSEYVKQQLVTDLEAPTLREWLARLEKRRPVELSVSAADIIREERARG